MDERRDMLEQCPCRDWRPVHTSNNVEATFDYVEKIVRLVAFDNVASTLLLMWTGLNTRSVEWSDKFTPFRLRSGWVASRLTWKYHCCEKQKRFNSSLVAPWYVTLRMQRPRALSWTRFLTSLRRRNVWCSHKTPAENGSCFAMPTASDIIVPHTFSIVSPRPVH